MKKLNDAVEKNRQLILDAERYIWQNPETGYKEFKTHKYMQEKFLALGYELTYADGITGFTTEIDTGKDGPTLLILGELDSIICPTHPESDKETSVETNDWLAQARQALQTEDEDELFID